MKKHVIQFYISRGDTHYIATGANFPVVTEGKTLDELVENLREAVALQLEGENLEDFDLAPSPIVLANLEIPTVAHA